MLTERALLVCQWPGIERLVNEPLNGTFRNDCMIEPDDLSCIKYETTSNFTVSRLPHSSGAFVAFIHTEAPNVTARVSYGASQPMFFAICSNPAYFDKLHAYGLVASETLATASARINGQHSRKEQRLDAVLSVGFEAAGNFLRKHWTPRRRIQEHIDSFYAKHFHAHFVVGIQISHDETSSSGASALLLTDVHKYLAPFVQCALHIEALSRPGYVPARWFVVSEEPKVVKELLASEYASKLVRLDVDAANSALLERRDTRDLVNYELLSRCNAIIVANTSTLAFLAAMRARFKPYLVADADTKQCEKMLLGRSLHSMIF